MNRQIILILLFSITGLLFLKASQVFRQNDQQKSLSDTVVVSGFEKLMHDYNIPEPAFNLAMNGYYELKSRGLLKNDTLLVIVDFSKASDVHRFFIIDLKNESLVKATYVAHGMHTGIKMAESFSNRRLSYKSSLGLYLTQETYQGKHGYSLRIEGLSKDLNDNAYKRAIVIHGADYVSEDFIKQNGRLGRSFGCPAVPMNEVNEIIDLIKNGTCLYIYHPSLIPISQSALEKLP